VNSRSLTTTVKRRHLPAATNIAKRTLDTREYDICKRIWMRMTEILGANPASIGAATYSAIGRTFDEDIIAQHIEFHHGLGLSASSVFSALHKLSEQTYENKSLTFGCILEPGTGDGSTGDFPDQYLRTKKYKALSDGFRTAFRVSPDGSISGLVDLQTRYSPLSEKHYFPDWARFIAAASRSGKCGTALSRQGDILVFDEGTLRFTYRYGRWQYWNHAHIVNLLRDRAKAQKVQKNVLGFHPCATRYRCLFIKVRHSFFSISASAIHRHQRLGRRDVLQITLLEETGIDPRSDLYTPGLSVFYSPRPIA
jgi:hypothetical protein